MSGAQGQDRDAPDARPTAAAGDIAAPRPRRRFLALLRWSAFAGVAGVVVALAILVGLRSGAWSRWPELLVAAERWRLSPIAPLIALAAFAVGGVIVFPVNLLIAATVVIFGPRLGTLVALAGSVASAAIVHQIGRWFPAGVFARLIGARGEHLRERVARHGVVAVALVRIVPVAPYSIVGLAAGAAHVPRGPYLLGTALGNLPGIVLYALFVDRAREVLADPRLSTFASLGFAIALVAAAAWLSHRYGRRRREETSR